MTPNDIEIQTPVAIRLVPAGTAEELGCTTARYDVAVTVNTSEKRIGCLTKAGIRRRHQLLFRRTQR